MTHLPIHTVHIPVMGTGFTIDTPIKVARFGISSVMSIGDDELCETVRKHYCAKYDIPFEPIKKWDEDFRARRITAYLDLVHDIVTMQVSELKSLSFEPDTELSKYFELLPTDSPLRLKYMAMKTESNPMKREEMASALRDSVVPGFLDVNIMTKIDRLNYSKQGELLPEEFSDALSALRGYANSKLDSSIVFSAGFNRRLYAYVERFSDFFPDTAGKIKKKVILKVSDFRSSLTQGKFFAKKGIWVSEHRIESGLNCGGHAFATDGFLLGPILDEFYRKKEDLIGQLLTVCNGALTDKGRNRFETTPSTRITVQGGIGTYLEDRFLMTHFNVDGTGWATPFLLVPEATTVDEPTRLQLATTTSEDLYLSGVSPLGVPFNTYRGSASERLKLAKAAEGKPGSPCPKGHLVSNTEFTGKPICTASSVYQKKKIAQLQDSHLTPEQYQKAYQKVIDKSCLCEDLAAGALVEYGIDNQRALASAVCPGPNLAHFSKISTLAEMMDHIYGRGNLLNDTYRPNMFISELKMYIDYLGRQIGDTVLGLVDRKMHYFREFRSNLEDGIAFYYELIPTLSEFTHDYREQMTNELTELKRELAVMVAGHPAFFDPQTPINA
ncbi:hypothetical protein EBR57_04585 [bacterium]|nr:hypothetical protein [bacterium]